MAQPIAKSWTTEEFFGWQERQEERYELVGGFPLRMMAGAKNRHDDIAVNLIIAFGNKLRGGRCTPFTGDGSVETFLGQIRRPDVGVDCGVRDPNGLQAAEPRLVAEILSPSTRDSDTLEKVPEYKAVESIDTILVVEPNAADVFVWRRGADRGWTRERIEGLDETIPLPSLGIQLTLAEIYEGIAFPVPPPRFTGLGPEQPGPPSGR